MQQFIPFEDDWDALEQLRPEALIPYRVGYVALREAPSAAADENGGPGQAADGCEAG